MLEIVHDIEAYERRYDCCCGRMHSVQGCRLIGFVEIAATILAIVLLFVFYFVFYSDTYVYQLIVGTGALVVGIVCCLGAFAAVFALFVGLRYESSLMLLWHIAAQVIALIGCVFAGIVGIVNMIGWSWVLWGSEVYLRPSLDSEGRIQDQYAARKTSFEVGTIVLILSVIGAILDTWFMIVVITAFRYFKKQERNNM